MRQAMDEHKRPLETDGIAYRADLAFHTAIAEDSKNPFGITVLQMNLGASDGAAAPH